MQDETCVSMAIKARGIVYITCYGAVMAMVEPLPAGHKIFNKGKKVWSTHFTTVPSREYKSGKEIKGK